MFCLLLLMLLLRPAPATAQENGTKAMRQITVAMDREYNPYEFTIGNNVALGYTPELLRAIASHNNWQMRFLPMVWPEAIKALRSHQVDMVSMIRTPDRNSRYLFSSPIATIDQSLFVRSKDTDRVDLAHLAGKVIGLQKGSIAGEAMQNRNDFKRYWVESKEDGFLALQDGAVDGFFCATLPGVKYLENFHLHNIVISASGLFPHSYAFAVEPKNRKLLTAIDRTLDDLKSSGELATIKRHWLEEGLGTATWWQRHLPVVVTLFAGMFLGLAIFSIWTFILQRKHRHKSLLVEQALDITTELVNDLTEQKRQAELYLEISEAMIIGLDESGKINLANHRAGQILGKPVAELIGLNWFDTFLTEPNRDTLREVHRKNLASRNGEQQRFDNEITTADGEIRVIQWHNRPQLNRSGEVTGTISSGIDITQRILTQQQLFSSRESYKQLSDQFESLLNGVTDPLLVIDRNRIIRWANSAARSSWCFTKAEPGEKICHQGPLCKETCDEGCIVLRCFESGEEFNESIYDPDHGRTMKVRIFPAMGRNEAPNSVIILAQDITDVLRTRAEMARASQLASVGELAANVAHEINNPLHGVINYAEIVKSRVKEDEFLADLAARIISEGERIRLIVKNLLSYTRRKEEKLGPVSLADVISSADMLIGIKLKMSGIQTRIEFPDNLPLVKASSNQLQQVIINLLGNAHDALIQKSFQGEQQPQVILRAEAGKDVVTVSVEDNGTGIPEHLRKRIMEAFFTTKPEGHGTGLGLSICKSIIEEHRGELQIDSREGEWTRISFTLPIFTRKDIG